MSTSALALTITPTYYRVLAAGLFTSGSVGVLVRRNVSGM
jgi:NADH:ubiquinone oxidoreductase subunit K